LGFWSRNCCRNKVIPGSNPDKQQTRSKFRMKHSHEQKQKKRMRTGLSIRLILSVAVVVLAGIAGQAQAGTNDSPAALTNHAATPNAVAPQPAAKRTALPERAQAGTFTSALESQVHDTPQPAAVAKEPPLTFTEKTERFGLVLLSILACFHFGPKWYRKWKARPDAWAEMQSQVVDVSSGAVGEQISFSQFASKLQTTAAATPGSADQAGLQQYLQIAPNQIGGLRRTFSEIEAAADEPDRQKTIAALYRDLQTFRTIPGLQAHYSAWELSGALEGLLKQMTGKADNVTVSTLRTAEAGLVLLEELSHEGVNPDLSRVPPARLLVVDDDPISRVAVSSSLKKVFAQPDVAPDGNAGFALAEKTAYDLAFLDIEMPGMDGYELCAKIHETTANASTPVVFVTRHSDFETRAKSARSGGQDLIAKPFLSFEITVKAISMVLRRRLGTPAPETEPNTADKQQLPGTKLPEAPKAQSGPIQPPAQTIVAAANTPPKPQPASPATPAQTPAASAPPPASATRAEVSRNAAPTFFSQAPTHIEAIRHQLQALSYAGPEAGNTDIFRNVNVSMLWLAAEAERAGLAASSRLASTLQALMKKLIENRKNVTPSTLAAAGAAVDLLEEFCSAGSNPDLADPPIRILVVDDDPIARRAMSGAIQLAFSKPDAADTGEEAVAQAVEKKFDVIFMDIQMPGMDGFAACARIHETALNAQTPVLFVTSHSDLKSREKATEAGGCGFIPKPVLAAEITLQALTLILRARLGRTVAEPQLVS
jgi:CheY-like chemotaxis protein